jgi:hypothetical protein
MTAHTSRAGRAPVGSPVHDRACRPNPTDVIAGEYRSSGGNDRLRYRVADDYADMGPDRDSPPSRPRWVKASAMIAIVLVLPFVGLHLTGNVPTHTPAEAFLRCIAHRVSS